LFAAACFFLSGLLVLAIREPVAAQSDGAEKRRGGLVETWRALRRDRGLRLLAVVTLLFGFSYAMNPHYQAFARKRLGIGSEELVVWVIAQTITVSLCSLVVGPLADRRGYRVTLRLALGGTMLGPIVAILVSLFPAEIAAHAYWLVFIPLGISPLVGPLLANYALELGPTEEHPRYISTVSLALMPAYLLSPLVGQLVDVVGFHWVFSGTAVVLAASVLLTWWLRDPRRHPHEEPLFAAPSEDD
jgi:predicted MFS family arabinose efflux permease